MKNEQNFFTVDPHDFHNLATSLMEMAKLSCFIETSFPPVPIGLIFPLNHLKHKTTTFRFKIKPKEEYVGIIKLSNKQIFLL